MYIENGLSETSADPAPPPQEVSKPVYNAPATPAPANKKVMKASHKKTSSPFLPILIAIIAFSAVFVLIISPKFLGVQILPFDPFGFSSSSEEDDVASGPEPEMADIVEPDNGEVKIDRLSLLIDDSLITQATAGISSPPVNYETKVDEHALFKVQLEPAAATANVTTKWAVGDSGIASFEFENTFDALLSVKAPGQTHVMFTVFSNNGAQTNEMTVLINLIVTELSFDEKNPPFAGDVFVTNDPKTGIFIRSDHIITGEGNKINDGNKIGWIAGGDTSVELIATGKKYHEGDDGFWWYEVEIPQWYRDTKKQNDNFAGRPMVGWVRQDVVKQIR